MSHEAPPSAPKELWLRDLSDEEFFKDADGKKSLYEVGKGLSERWEHLTPEEQQPYIQKYEEKTQGGGAAEAGSAEGKDF